MYTPPQFINTTYKEWREVFMHSTVVCIRTSIRRTSITAFETSFLLCSPFALSDFRSVEAESVGWRTRQQLTCTVSLEWLEKFDSSSLLSSNDRVGANNSQKKRHSTFWLGHQGRKVAEREGCGEKVHSVWVSNGESHLHFDFEQIHISQLSLLGQIASLSLAVIQNSQFIQFVSQSLAFTIISCWSSSAASGSLANS